jgi:LysM domain
LLETGDHSRLGFHPSCPVCRQERLRGSLSSEPVISRRLQAALASGLLALSAVAPGAVAAPPEPDQQREGVAAPEAPPAAPLEQPVGGAPQQPGSGDVDAPDFDPGGETPLPFEVAPTPDAGGGSEDSGDGPPVESEPIDDPDAELLAPTDPGTETPPAETETPVPPAEVAPVPPAPPVLPAPPAPQPTIIEAPPASPDTPAAPSAPVARPKAESNPQDEADRARERSGARELPAKPAPSAERIPTQSPAPAIAVPPQSVTPASPTPTAPPPEPVLLVPADPPPQSAPPPLPESARAHVVERGESLWSIASRMLGSDASPGRIAAEVNRLWELNEDRIGTGNPDLLMIGTTLRLR